MTHETYEQERRARAAQLVVRARGRGYVELSFENGSGELPSSDGVHAKATLQYPVSGTMIGDPPRDVQNAETLQIAVKALNEALLSLTS